MQDTTSNNSDPFFDARIFLEGMIECLRTQKWLHAEHGEVEELIHKDGFELMRRLLQAHLNERSEQEPQFTSVYHDGHEHNQKRQMSTRHLSSLFGEVVVARKSYSVAGADSLFPQDGALNLSADQYSDGLRREIAFTVSEQSFDKSSESILRTTAGIVPKRQVGNVTRHLSQDFDEFYSCSNVEVNDDSSLLVLSCDGKGIVMRQSDLRPITQKAAAAAQQKKQTRLSRGEKGNRKRMATAALVYDIPPHIRSAASIMGREEKNPAPRHSNKRAWASVEKSSLRVIEEMFAEALRRDPEQRRKWVVVVDGHPIQLKQIRKVMKKQKIKATIVVDFIHVLEYLWKAAYCFFDETSQKAEDWVMVRALKILSGEASQVAAGIRRSCTKRKLNSQQRKKADLCSDYLLKKKPYLRYDNYLAEGYPIASGAIEGTCRYLIKDRMDITGARWGLQGAEAVLKLRAIITNNDFEEYFRFHKSKELNRNYPFYEKIAYKMAA